jgi:hypothetical protein
MIKKPLPVGTRTAASFVGVRADFPFLKTSDDNLGNLILAKYLILLLGVIMAALFLSFFTILYKSFPRRAFIPFS